MRIPDSGYFSPEAIVTCLSVLTRLENLIITFEPPQSHSDKTSGLLFAQTRTLLPVLTTLNFMGVSEYLEDLVARVDAPLLQVLKITFPELISGAPQLAQFISRTPKLMERDKIYAYVDFSNKEASLRLVWTASDYSTRAAHYLDISCRRSDRQLPSLAQVCSSSLPQPLISMVKELYISTPDLKPNWQDDTDSEDMEQQDEIESTEWGDDIENIQWLEFLQLFAAVESLTINPATVVRIGPALLELVGERVTDVLPALITLLFEDTSTALPSPADQKPILRFVAARRLAGHPIHLSGLYSYLTSRSKLY